VSCFAQFDILSQFAIAPASMPALTGHRMAFFAGTEQLRNKVTIHSQPESTGRGHNFLCFGQFRDKTGIPSTSKTMPAAKHKLRCE